MKRWVKNRLERLLLCRAFVRREVVKSSSISGAPDTWQIIIPHRVNWPLTTAAVKAFARLSTGNFSITLVVNFDQIPNDWECLKIPNLTIVRNSSTSWGNTFRLLFNQENGSMGNALALETGLWANPDFQWAFIVHSDSAPLTRDWNSHFFGALGQGSVVGNMRDRIRVNAAHSSGTLFNQQEFLRRKGSVWPLYHWGAMVWDVSDGITMALHPPKKGPVPVLPNTLQEPELIPSLHKTMPLLAEFAESGTRVTFNAERTVPVFAHMGRGTPRSENAPSMAHKPAVERWIEWIDSLI